MFAQAAPNVVGQAPGALSQELWAPSQEGEGLPWTGGTSPGGGQVQGRERW